MVLLIIHKHSNEYETDGKKNIETHQRRSVPSLFVFLLTPKSRKWKGLKQKESPYHGNSGQWYWCYVPERWDDWLIFSILFVVLGLLLGSEFWFFVKGCRHFEVSSFGVLCYTSSPVRLGFEEGGLYWCLAPLREFHSLLPFTGQRIPPQN